MWKWWKMKEYGENGLGLRAVAHGGGARRGRTAGRLRGARRGGAGRGGAGRGDHEGCPYAGVETCSTLVVLQVSFDGRMLAGQVSFSTKNVSWELVVHRFTWALGEL